MLEGHTKMDKDFTREAAATLAIRGVKQTKEGSYQFTRDLRAKAVRMVSYCHLGISPISLGQLMVQLSNSRMCWYNKKNFISSSHHSLVV